MPTPLAVRGESRSHAAGAHRAPAREASLADDALLVAALLTIDPRGLGGVVLDHPMHEQVRAFTHALQQLLPEGAPLRRVPIGVTADRLIGGVDLASTLGSGRLIAERGVLAAADGGVVVLPMAERATVSVRTTLAEALDHGALRVARDGVAARHDVRVLAVLLDESVEDEEVHPALIDRVAFRMSFGASIDTLESASLQARVRDARERVDSVAMDDVWVEALCESADAFGIASLRAPLFAVRCARAHAALAGRSEVTVSDAEVAARLVLTPRATRLPAEPPGEAPEQTPPPEASEQSETPPEARADDSPPELPPQAPPADAEDDNAADERAEPPLPSESELLRAAVRAALPKGLLEQLMARAASGSVQGRVGEEVQSLLRGRPRGARSGLPRGGARLHLLETLRAAAPWQRVRERASNATRVAIRREDFRVRRFVERTGTTVIFLVDASGSSALQRLAEAKGAIELLLAESYARRDRVCLIAFRGAGTELLLPPTRALARARRVLAALPGGGGTPMATAIDAATQQAIATRRDGSVPLVVMLSDGRANIARDGTPGRPAAERDALLAGKAFAQFNVSSLFVDTSPRGEPVARRIAESMRARYVQLPYADAKALGGLVRTTMQLAEGA